MSPGREFEAASPYSRPRFITFTNPNHVGVTSTRFTLALATGFIQGLPVKCHLCDEGEETIERLLNRMCLCKAILVGLQDL